MRTIIIILALFVQSCVKGQIIGYVTSFSATDITNANYVLDGNSYTVWNGPSNTALKQLEAMSPFSSNGSTFTNFGVSGQTTGNMLSDQYSQVLPALEPGVVNFLIIEEGGNDLGNSPCRVDTAMARMRRYCTNARNYAAANDITLFIIVSTKIPRQQADNCGTQAAFNIKLLAFNDSTLADNNTHWDYTIRPDTSALFATYSAGGYDPAEVASSAAVHPGVTGQGLYAKLYKEAIFALTGYTSRRKIYKQTEIAKR